MRIDHVLVTRFNLPSEGAEKLIRAQDGWLRDRIELFERYTVPSVRSQSATAFHWIVYLDVESPQWLLDRLRPLADDGLLTPLFRETVDWADLAADARTVTRARGDILLTTNLDNDDALATNFVERLQAAVRPGVRESIFLGRGLIVSGAKVYRRTDRMNAFCSVAEPWDGAQTAWRDWHILLGKHMPSRVLAGAPAWLQVIHGRNVSNRVRGWLTSPNRYVALFPGQLDGLPALGLAEQLADRMVYMPLREARELVRVLAKSILLRLLGKDGLSRLSERLQRIR